MPHGQNLPFPTCTDSRVITGRSWAATSTEGLLIYSLDHNLVFDPYDLEMEITPINVKKTLQDEDYSTAVMLAFRLNEHALIQEVVETIPVKEGRIFFPFGYICGAKSFNFQIFR